MKTLRTILFVLFAVTAFESCDFKVKTSPFPLSKLLSMALTGTAVSTVAAPTLNPPPGTYTSEQAITLSTATNGAEIFYTTDGTAPNSKSTKYTTALKLASGGKTTTIQAIAVKSGMQDSGIASGSYIMNYIASPTFNPLPDIYGSDQSVTLDTTTFGATIYYTLNGMSPTPTSTQYSSAISIAGNGTTKTIKAIAVKSGIPDSPIVSGTYTIDTTLALVSINSVSPGTTINGTTDPQINWQSNAAGTYVVKIGGTNCLDGTTVSGTNVSGSIVAASPIVTTVSVSSLSSGTNTIRFCVLKYPTGNYGSVTQSITKDTFPTIGNNGIILFQNMLTTSLTLKWTKATDDITAQASLQYKIVRSLSNNIDTVSNAETNGTIIQNWTANIDTLNVSGLTANTLYYFNVLVKDSIGNKAGYTMISTNQEVYEFGTFTDNMNGTVSFAGKGSLASYNWIWMKCSQGQTWNSLTNGCDGTVSTYAFCGSGICWNNGSNLDGTYELDGTGTSPAYTICNSMSFSGISTWRVPRDFELQSLLHCTDRLLSENCSSYTSPAINRFFPNTPTDQYYWSNNVTQTTVLGMTTRSIKITHFGFGSTTTLGNITLPEAIRCVSGP